MSSSNGTVLFLPTDENIHCDAVSTSPAEEYPSASLVSPSQRTSRRGTQTTNLNQNVSQGSAIVPNEAQRGAGANSEQGQRKGNKRSQDMASNPGPGPKKTRKHASRLEFGPETDQEATDNLNSGATQHNPDATDMFGPSSNNDAQEEYTAQYQSRPLQNGSNYSDRYNSPPLQDGSNNNHDPTQVEDNRTAYRTIIDARDPVPRNNGALPSQNYANQVHVLGRGVLANDVLPSQHHNSTQDGPLLPRIDSPSPDGDYYYGREKNFHVPPRDQVIDNPEVIGEMLSVRKRQTQRSNVANNSQPSGSQSAAATPRHHHTQQGNGPNYQNNSQHNVSQRATRDHTQRTYQNNSQTSASHGAPVAARLHTQHANGQTNQNNSQRGASQSAHAAPRGHPPHAYGPTNMNNSRRSCNPNSTGHPRHANGQTNPNNSQAGASYPPNSYFPSNQNRWADSPSDGTAAAPRHANGLTYLNNSQRSASQRAPVVQGGHPRHANGQTNPNNSQAGASYPPNSYSPSNQNRCPDYPRDHTSHPADGQENNNYGGYDDQNNYPNFSMPAASHPSSHQRQYTQENAGRTNLNNSQAGASYPPNSYFPSNQNRWPDSPIDHTSHPADGQEDNNYGGYDDRYGAPKGYEGYADYDEQNFCQGDEPEYGDDTVCNDVRQKQPATKDLSPHTMGQVSRVNNLSGIFTFKTLFDSGATLDLVKRSALPRGVKVHALESGGSTKRIQTTNGAMKASEFVNLENISFPEFGTERHLPKLSPMVFDDNQVIYDLIIGRKTMSKMGLQLNFDAQSMEWMDKKVPFHPIDFYSDKASVGKVLDNGQQRIRGGGDPECGDDDEEEQDDEYEESHYLHNREENLMNLPMPKRKYNEEYSKSGGPGPPPDYIRPGQRFTPNNPSHPHLALTHTIRPGTGVHPASDGTREHYVTRTNNIACMDRRESPILFTNLAGLNTATTRWDSDTTLGDASRAFFAIMEETMHYYPSADILGNTAVTKNMQVNKRNSFMRGHVACTVGRVLLGPNYNFRNLGGVPLRDIGTKVPLTALEVSLVYGLPEVYSGYWDSTISANEILDIVLYSHEKQCGDKMQFGFWSDEEVLLCMRNRERLDNHVCRGMAWPYVKACDQIIQEFNEKHANKKAPGNKRFITDAQKLEWREGFETRIYRYG